MCFPRTANLILKKHIIHDGLHRGGRGICARSAAPISAPWSTRSRPPSPTSSSTLSMATATSRSSSRWPRQGCLRSKLPVMSFSIAEQEAKAMGPSLVQGSYAAWNYFQSLDDPASKKFVAGYQSQVRRRLGGRRSDGAWISRRLRVGGGGRKGQKLRRPRKVRKAAVKLDVERLRDGQDQVRRQPEPLSDRLRRASSIPMDSSRSCGIPKSRSRRTLRSAGLSGQEMRPALDLRIDLP